jgi:hypothetical protein
VDVSDRVRSRGFEVSAEYRRCDLETVRSRGFEVSAENRRCDQWMSLTELEVGDLRSLLNIEGAIRHLCDY